MGGREGRREGGEGKEGEFVVETASVNWLTFVYVQSFVNYTSSSKSLIIITVSLWLFTFISRTEMYIRGYSDHYRKGNRLKNKEIGKKKNLSQGCLFELQAQEFSLIFMHVKERS